MKDPNIVYVNPKLKEMEKSMREEIKKKYDHKFFEE